MTLNTSPSPNLRAFVSAFLLTLPLACEDTSDTAVADATDTGDAGDGDGDGDANDFRARPRVVPPPLFIPTGAQWGPCDLTDADQPGWWGCDGEPGFGLACARPVSDGLNLNICVPQTWDPDVANDCSGLTAPFGNGVRLQGSAYCVVDCDSDSDCAGGMACAPASHMCAWKG